MALDSLFDTPSPMVSKGNNDTDKPVLESTRPMAGGDVPNPEELEDGEIEDDAEEPEEDQASDEDMLDIEERKRRKKRIKNKERRKRKQTEKKLQQLQAWAMAMAAGELDEEGEGDEEEFMDDDYDHGDQQEVENLKPLLSPPRLGPSLGPGGPLNQDDVGNQENEQFLQRTFPQGSKKKKRKRKRPPSPGGSSEEGYDDLLRKEMSRHHLKRHTSESSNEGRVEDVGSEDYSEEEEEESHRHRKKKKKKHRHSSRHHRTTNKKSTPKSKAKPKSRETEEGYNSNQDDLIYLGDDDKERHHMSDRGGQNHPMGPSRGEMSEQDFHMAMQEQEGKVHNPKTHLICKFFLEGKCKKGLDCLYTHEGSIPKRPEQCKFYLQGYCQKGPLCMFLHHEYPCKYYHTGQVCYAGDKCRFSHEPPTEELKPIIAAMMNESDDGPQQMSSPQRETNVPFQKGSKGGGRPGPQSNIPSLFEIKVKPIGQKGQRILEKERQDAMENERKRNDDGYSQDEEHSFYGSKRGTNYHDDHHSGSNYDDSYDDFSYNSPRGPPGQRYNGPRFDAPRNQRHFSPQEGSQPPLLPLPEGVTAVDPSRHKGRSPPPSDTSRRDPRRASKESQSEDSKEQYQKGDALSDQGTIELSSQSDGERSDVEKLNIDTERTDSEKQSDFDRQNSDFDRTKSDSDKLKSDSDRQISDFDKQKSDADIQKSDSEKRQDLGAISSDTVSDTAHDSDRNKTEMLNSQTDSKDNESDLDGSKANRDENSTGLVIDIEPPVKMPAKSKALFMRIQQKEAKKLAEAEATDDDNSKDTAAADENWYSSDEEDTKVKDQKVTMKEITASDSNEPTDELTNPHTQAELIDLGINISSSNQGPLVSTTLMASNKSLNNQDQNKQSQLPGPLASLFSKTQANPPSNNSTSPAPSKPLPLDLLALVTKGSSSVQNSTNPQVQDLFKGVLPSGQNTKQSSYQLLECVRDPNLKDPRDGRQRKTKAGMLFRVLKWKESEYSVHDERPTLPPIELHTPTDMQGPPQFPIPPVPVKPAPVDPRTQAVVDALKKFIDDAQKPVDPRQRPKDPRIMQGPPPVGPHMPFPPPLPPPGGDGINMGPRGPHMQQFPGQPPMGPPGFQNRPRMQQQRMPYPRGPPHQQGLQQPPLLADPRYPGPRQRQPRPMGPRGYHQRPPRPGMRPPFGSPPHQGDSRHMGPRDPRINNQPPPQGGPPQDPRTAGHHPPSDPRFPPSDPRLTPRLPPPGSRMPPSDPRVPPSDPRGPPSSPRPAPTDPRLARRNSAAAGGIDADMRQVKDPRLARLQSNQNQNPPGDPQKGVGQPPPLLSGFSTYSNNGPNASRGRGRDPRQGALNAGVDVAVRQLSGASPNSQEIKSPADADMSMKDMFKGKDPTASPFL